MDKLAEIQDWSFSNTHNSKPSGVKYDTDKPRYDLIPLGVVEGVARVLTHGANKYSDDNWRKVDNGRDRYYAATIRHIEAWRAGEVDDTESGLHHLSHAITNLMFLDSGEFD